MIDYSYIMAKGSSTINAIRLVLGSKAYLFAFLLITALSFFGYSFLISSSSLNLSQPKIALGLNIYSLTASALISVLLGLSLAANAYAFANRASTSSKTGFGAVIAAILPSSLCCTSFIPAILAAFGASTSTILGITGTIQGPFATYEILFIISSIILLVFSVLLVTRNIDRCCKVKK